ncbi:MAG: hypothetical protein MJ119_01635, partial [Lachnospiraceae bacterium]|nr:hypothetical protein [Lachnospiraceae bacterium]
MKKRILSFVLSVLMVVSLMPTVAWADDSITYIERSWNGTEIVEEAKTITDYMAVTEEYVEEYDGFLYLESGYYVVCEDVETTGIYVELMDEDPIYLILCDGMTISANVDGFGIPAVQVGEGSSLVICGQSGDTGKLIASGDGGAAGIGSGLGEAGGDIVICGGTVVAKGGQEGGAGIGNGSGIDLSGGSVTVNGGIVKATGGEGAAGIGGGNGSTAGTLTINGGSVTARGGEGAPGIGDGLGTGDAGTVTVNGGSVTRINGFCEELEYYEWDDVNNTMVKKTIDEYEFVTDETEVLDGGYYVVQGDVETGCIDVSGTEDNPTYLILCDGATLNARAQENTAMSGIHVVQGKALVICGQSGNTGKLKAYGDSAASGIGGGMLEGCGLITINGGGISAVGGGGKMMEVSGGGFGFCGGGAGIGGGYSNTSNDTVTVNGGIVTAQGNELGAGIGGGGYGESGAVTINGGTVTAIGSQYGAGIGGGGFKDGGSLTVNGGTVTAESEFGAGIGAGEGYDGGTFTVAGSHEVWSGSSESSVIVVTLTGSSPPSGSYVKITEKLQRIPTITTTPSASAIVCGQALSASSLTGGAADTEGTFAWKDGTIIPSLSDSESTEYDVVFTPTETTNYTTVELKVKVKVNKASQSEVTVTMSGYTYGETPSTPGLSGTVEENPTVTYYYNDSNSFTGATEWKNITSTTLDAGTYYMFATLSETSGFSSYTTAGTSFAVAKVGSTCTAPVAKIGLKYNSINQTLITAGSTEDGTLKYSLTGTDDYSESLPFGQDAGEYRVYYKVFGDMNHNDSTAAYVTVTIDKTDWIITTEPEAKTGLVYDALAQELVSPGAAGGDGVLKYSLTADGTFTADIPEGTDAGTYSVFYKVEADLNHNEFVCEAPITVSIAKADWTVTEPTGNSLSYTGTDQALVTAGTVKDVQGNLCENTMLYSLTGEATDFSTTLPTAKEVGEYTIYYKVAGNDNYNEYAASTVNASIGKTDRTDIPSVIMNGYTYDTSEDVPAPSLDATPEENPTVTYYYNDTDSFDEATEWKDITSTTLDAGTYYMFATLSETASYRSCTTAGTAFVIAKAESSCTAPVAKIGLKYNSINQTLITAGSTEDGTLKYSLTGTDDYSESLPFGRDAGEYKVYYKVFGDTNHNDSSASFITVSTAKTDWIITTEPEAKTGLVYNALAQELVSPGAAGGDGVIKYSLTTDGTFTADIPEGTDAGTYSVFYKVEADLNHNEFVCEAPVSVSIAKADWTVTSPTGNSLSYTGTDQALVTAGSVKDVQGNLCENTMLYSLTGEAADYSTTLPTAKEVGEYTIYYKVAGNDNYNEYTASTVTASIGKVDRTDIPSVIMSGYTFDTTETLPAPSLDATPEENPEVVFYYNTENSYAGATEWKDITSTTLNAGTYYMFAELGITESYAACKTEIVSFTVEKAESTCIAPAAIPDLKYNGWDLWLVSEGSTEDGTLVYSLTGNDDDYSESRPSGKNAGSYIVYYKVLGDANHKDSEPASVNVSIAKTDWIVTAEPEAKTGLVYNALGQELVTPGSCSGTMKYRLETADVFSEDIPEGTDAGTYNIFYKVEEDTNHNEFVCEAPISVSIAKADWNIISPTGNSLSYTGTDQALVTAGSVKDVQGNLCENTMLYSLTGEAADFSTTLPTAKEVGEYTIYYKVAGNDNYNEYAACTVKASIGKTDRTDIPTVIMDGYTFDTTETLPTPSLDATPEENPEVVFYY